MTAPDRDQATCDRLADVLLAEMSEVWDFLATRCDVQDVRHFATALLPVVADLVREGQAEALETAADVLHDLGVRQVRADAFDSADLIRQRAVALRAPRPGATP